MMRIASDDWVIMYVIPNRNSSEAGGLMNEPLWSRIDQPVQSRANKAKPARSYISHTTLCLCCGTIRLLQSCMITMRLIASLTYLRFGDVKEMFMEEIPLFECI